MTNFIESEIKDNSLPFEDLMEKADEIPIQDVVEEAVTYERNEVNRLIKGVYDGSAIAFSFDKWLLKRMSGVGLHISEVFDSENNFVFPDLSQNKPNLKMVAMQGLSDQFVALSYCSDSEMTSLVRDYRKSSYSYSSFETFIELLEGYGEELNIDENIRTCMIKIYLYHRILSSLED